MITQKKRCGWLSITLVLLPIAAILSGCGGKVEESKTPATVSPADQQKFAAETQQGMTKEAARKQAEAEYLAKKKSTGTQ